MANIVIKEILASDTVSDLVDKVNFNFDQLLLNGGGPSGPTGITGIQGPIGPRGVVWFTANDLYNTDLTTVTDPPLVFPLWTGTPLKVNNIALPGYPQFKGDPNRYQPNATSGTGVYPYYSFIIGTTGKLPKSGDLYLQEGDDTYNSYSSTDGDIWEFNAVGSTWTYTGVNIKGNTGGQGTAGATEWARENDGSVNLNDYLRPSEVSGNDPIVRVVIGADSTTADNIINESGEWSDNVLTLFQNVTGSGYQLAFTDSNSIQAPTFSTSDYAKIGTATNKLFIYGFDDNTSSNNNRDVVIGARAGRVVLNATDPITSVTQSAYLDVVNRNFVIQNASLNISCAPGTAPVPSGNTGVEHILTDNTIALRVRHNQNATYGGWTSGESIRMYTVGSGNSDMYLQELSINRTGIGPFNSSRVSGKLGINNINVSIPSFVVGSSWSVNSLITSSNATETIGNSSFFEGQISIGTTTSSGNPAKLGNATQNSISTKSSVVIQNGLVGFNTFVNASSNALAAAYTDSTMGNYFISPGKFLSSTGISGSGSATTDLDGSIVLAGPDSNVTTLGTVYGISSIFTNLRYNPGIAFKSTTRQVLLNTQKFTNSSSIASSNLMSSGGAIIGKITRFTGDTLFGHEDSIANNNVVIGYPIGTATNQPRVVLTGAGSSTITPTANTTYITTPVWNGSMAFDKTDELHTATIYSKSSYQSSPVYGGYQSYLPSIRSQYKIVHGLKWNLTYTSMLNNTENPSDTPIGLEIETRHTAPNYMIVSTGANRSPVITRSSGAYVPGNRPLLITKRSIMPGAEVSTLLEVSPSNNISVGQALSFPSKSIYQGNNDRTSSPVALTYAIQDASSATSFNSTSADTWYNVTSLTGSKFILPESNRSLHVNSISIDNSLGIASNANEAYDLASGSILGGIVINSDVYLSSIKAGVQSAEVAYEDYYTGIAGYYHQITTPIISHKQQSSANKNMATAWPLGIKPGYVTLTTPSVGIKINNPAVIKGSDLILEAGDVIYDRAVGFNKFARPGDVFITAGTAYRNLYQGGYSNAKSDLSNASHVLQNTEMRNFGSIYIGSKATNKPTEGYTSTGIVKSGLVYVGYQSDDSRVFNSGINSFSPKGSASLNVASSDTDDASNSRDANALVSQGRAINIQQGDIVTRDQEAGWVEVDLTTVGISTGQSNIIYCYDTTNRKAFTSSTTGSVTPRWLIKYKVIGYTVHYIITLEGTIFKTTGDGANATIIMLNSANNLFGTVANQSLIPRPLAGSAASNVYSTTGNEYGLPGFNRSSSFSGTGSIVLRNSSPNFPVNGAGQGTIGVITPIQGAWDNINNRVSIYKSGSSAIQPFSATSAPINAYDPDLAKNIWSFRNYLVPTNGEEIAGNATVSNGTEIWCDIYMSGSYELDPQYWFG